jgi:cell division protein FtsQ
MKWKLNIRKEVRVALALMAVTFLIAFTERKQGGSVCTNILIEIENQHENHFVDEADVMKLVTGAGQPVIGTGINRINLKMIEEKIKSDKHIRDAELFGDLKGNLVVQVDLRRPVARIVQPDAPDAYIAEDGVVMPVSEKFTSRVMLISGSGVHALMESENLNTTETGRQLMEMIGFISNDKFWRAQIAQIDVAGNGKVTLYPQVTGQRVEFGKPDDLETKFKKLLVFYKEILPQRGWTKYERVNLEYAGQIIAE